MTLIASIPHFGIPLLFGDFMITALPDSDWTMKKIHRISPNFVVGWTGRAYIAEEIIGDLFRNFNCKQVTNAHIKNFLLDLVKFQLSKDNIQLTGWIVDKVATCFFWDSSKPSEVEFPSYKFAGSGGNTLKDYIQNIAEIGSTLERQANFDRAVSFSIHHMGMLMCNEAVYKGNLENGFGKGYEVLIYNFEKKEFQYIDNILYTLWAFDYDPATDIMACHNLSLMYKYKNMDNFSIWQTINQKEKSTIVDTITPVHDRMYDYFDETPLESLIQPLVSDFYCMFNLLHIKGELVSLSSYNLDAKAENPGITISEDNKSLSLKKDIVMEILDDLKTKAS